MRFLLLGTAIYFTMRAGAEPVALLIGLSIAMPATLIDAWINRPPIVDPATLPVFLDDGIDEGEDDRLFRVGRLFTSKYSDRPADLTSDTSDAHAPSEDAREDESDASHDNFSQQSQQPRKGHERDR